MNGDKEDGGSVSFRLQRDRQLQLQMSGTHYHILSVMQMSTTVNAATLEEVIWFMAGSNVSKTHRPHNCAEAGLFTR